MINIIKPSQFVSLPWKNGKGRTTQLAINDNGTTTDFDWRISIASVVEDGYFSDFSGYERQLVLIAGHGIVLTHSQGQQDNLDQVLKVATFDGCWQTMGQLVNDPIYDFNVITRQPLFKVDVQTYSDYQTVSVPPCAHCFVYCLVGGAQIAPDQVLADGHLLHISDLQDDNMEVSGETMIVAILQHHV